jgi:hypothetical protein
MSNRTNEQVVLDYLSSGRNLTPAQANGSLRITDAYATVRDLRRKGYPVYSNRNSQGNLSWRLGTPSRKMVAAAYSAFGSDVFSS